MQSVTRRRRLLESERGRDDCRSVCRETTSVCDGKGERERGRARERTSNGSWQLDRQAEERNTWREPSFLPIVRFVSAVSGSSAGGGEGRKEGEKPRADVRRSSNWLLSARPNVPPSASVHPSHIVIPRDVELGRISVGGWRRAALV